jgi:hypothetical protein
MGLRVPVSSEARLVVLSEMLSVPKSTLMRELLMTAIIEAEQKLFDEVHSDNDQLPSDYAGRVHEVEQSILEGLSDEGEAS